jgi:hypothetical protein
MVTTSLLPLSVTVAYFVHELVPWTMCTKHLLLRALDL